MYKGGNAMDITVRRFVEKDGDAILSLGKRERWETPVRRPEEYRQVLRDSYTLVAEADGAFAGYARAISDGLVTTFLCELLVEPAFRKKGVASWLVDAVQAAFPLTRMDLISDADGFYRKNRFRKIGNGFRRGAGE